jgi:dihydroorotate dehydrogenase electron transfer subunit
LWFALPSFLAAEAGQFAMVRGTSWGDSPLLPRPMSLLGAGDEASILIKVVGSGTRRLSLAAPGEPFALLMPLGRGFRLPERHVRPLLVAGGVGVAPLVMLGEELARRGDGAPVTSLYGGRSAADLPLADRLAAAGDLEIATEDGSRGVRGRVTVLVERALDRAAASGTELEIYACGPHGMMAAVAALAQARGVACQTSLEAPMGCGYGVCLGCPVAKSDGGYLYTCVDGPCVDARAIDWSQPVF